MPDQGLDMPASKLRGAALATVTDLATGQFAERMRLDAAKRVIVMVRRVGVLHDLGQMQAPPQGWLSQIAHNWDPQAVTAREYVELLPTSDADRILTEATAWARGVQPIPAAANEDHRIARAAGA
ncbi:hypothetical protein ACQW02_04840 [Humitalea sp. 24SJ18S-53]|uniref:hypothetical protein n=1 Tax=Humitalea sp. 24SJ18S-53 TaxID=3422307 RepID=UPI003D678B94